MLGFIAQQFAQALGAGCFGVVDMHASDGAAANAATAGTQHFARLAASGRVIENMHPRRARMVPQQIGRFRVILRFHQIVVEEIDDGTAMLRQRKPLAVDGGFNRAAIINTDCLGIGDHIGAQLARWRFGRIVEAPLGHALRIVQRGLEKRLLRGLAVGMDIHESLHSAVG